MLRERERQRDRETERQRERERETERDQSSPSSRAWCIIIIHLQLIISLASRLGATLEGGVFLVAPVCAVPCPSLPPPWLVQLDLLPDGADGLRGQLEGLHHLIIILILKVTVKLELYRERALVAT